MIDHESESAEGQHSAFERVLVPIGKFQNTERLITRVIQLYRQRPIEIHLLNVQSPFPRHVAMFFSAQEVRRFHIEDATEELLPARALLVRAEVPFECHIEVGDYASSVAECARKQHCSHIILQDHGKGSVSRLVLGSLSNRVRQLVAGSNVLCELI